MGTKVQIMVKDSDKKNRIVKLKKVLDLEAVIQQMELRNHNDDEERTNLKHIAETMGAEMDALNAALRDKELEMERMKRQNEAEYQRNLDLQSSLDKCCESSTAKDAEISELRIQMRLERETRRADQDQSRDMDAKQEKEIESVNEDNERLKHELAAANDSARRSMAKKDTGKTTDTAERSIRKLHRGGKSGNADTGAQQRICGSKG